MGMPPAFLFMKNDDARLSLHPIPFARQGGDLFLIQPGGDFFRRNILECIFCKDAPDDGGLLFVDFPVALAKDFCE
jgi:hypothetical protein